MRNKKVLTIPKCDFCSQLGEYDAPTKMGPWANMCKEHYYRYSVSDMGTHFVLKDQQPDQDITVKGINTFDGEDRIVQCPKCKDERWFEVDASGKYRCECGVMISIRPVV